MSFKVGDRVRKVTGDYQVDGEVRAVFTTRAGKIRLVVEHMPGFLHIYSESNLVLKRLWDAERRAGCWRMKRKEK